MSNTSSNVLSFTGVVNSGTVNSCHSSEIDYTIYFKVVMFFLFVMTSALVSGLSASTGAIRSLVQAVKDHRQHTHRRHTQDIETQSSTGPVDEEDASDCASSEDVPAGKAPVGGSPRSDSDLEEYSCPGNLPRRPPPTRQSRGHKLWKKVKGALPDSAWPTLSFNTADVTATFALNGPSSLLPR